MFDSVVGQSCANNGLGLGLSMVSRGLQVLCTNGTTFAGQNRAHQLFMRAQWAGSGALHEFEVLDIRWLWGFWFQRITMPNEHILLHFTPPPPQKP